MACNLAVRFRSHLLRAAAGTTFIHHKPIVSSNLRSLLLSNPSPSSSFVRFLSTVRRRPTPSTRLDIPARARQLQTRRLWTYALTFSLAAGFIVIVISTFQENLVFYVTPTKALEEYSVNPSKNKFRLGGLVLEGSVTQPASSPDMEFVITDLESDILVRYQGSLPDLFREGHSVVAEGFIKPLTDEIRKETSGKGVSSKARSVECYLSATEVLAKHDEKYMPPEVAAEIEKNKKKIEAEAKKEKEKIGLVSPEAPESQS